jgi:hypothetical protein
MLLIFDYKPCQAPNYTKIVKYKWRERGSNVVCLVEVSLALLI